MVSTAVSTKKASEKEIIEANAQAIVNVKLSHRTSIKKVKKAYLVGCLAQSGMIKQYRLCLWAVHQLSEYEHRLDNLKTSEGKNMRPSVF